MQDIIRLTKDLIRFRTVASKPDEIRRCAAFIEAFLGELRVDFRRFDHGGVPSIAVLPQHEFAPILLMTHMDVVDGPEALFDPRERDGILHGRGSLDDKYAVAVSMILLKRHLQHLRGQGGCLKDLPFGILITGDEEAGGFSGANRVLQKIRSDFCIVLDGGGLEKIVAKERGIARVRLVCDAAAAPPGSKLKPIPDAAERLNEDIVGIRTRFVTSVPDHPDRAMKVLNILKEARQGPFPEQAEARIELKYAGDEDMEGFFDRLRRELHSRVFVESVAPLFPARAASLLELLLGLSPKTRVGFEDGSNDARFLLRYGISGIIWGADGGQSRHGASEHVELDSVAAVYGILDRFLRLQAGSASGIDPPG